MLGICTAHTQTIQTDTFTLKKPEITFHYTPKYPYLFRDLSHPFRITCSDTLFEFTVELAGGTIITPQGDTNIYLTPIVANQVLLNIRKKQDSTLLLTVPFKVIPEMRAYIQNTGSDSVLLDLLLLSGNIYGKSKSFKDNFKVQSYLLTYGSTSRTVIGDKIPVEDRQKIMNMENGSLITFSNIQVLLANNRTLTLQPYRVSMQKSPKNINRWGF